MLSKPVLYVCLSATLSLCVQTNLAPGRSDGFSYMADPYPYQDPGHQSCACCGVNEGAQRDMEAAMSLPQAAMYGDDSQVRDLVSRGADPCAADVARDYLTPIHYAVESGSAATVQALIEAGANVSAQTRYGVAPLHTATSNGQLAIVELLLAAGAYPSIANQDGATPLHAAAANWQPAIATRLLAAGADVHARDARGRTPLHEAARSESTTVAQLLLDAGADINAAGAATDPRTPLLAALDDAGSDAVRFLLDRGAAVPPANSRAPDDAQGNTLLHLAAQKSPELLRVLLAPGAGADLEAVNADGATPLHCAAMLGTVGQLRMLMDAGANVQARTKAGETVLHVAVANPAAPYLGMRRDALKKITLLIGAGVDVNAKTPGQTALDRAGRFESVANVLRENGATE
ncbi:Ankyrin repeat-containing domain [Cordyceps militaris]|uniref:Ankyrin repeat-containing domain n=1 Tax=Cordyceps militaris TaxID=73501 RepID=A0A2H4SCK4_CORMI|nr:Ankyrin repeat-containing domain [Cordyceps militaris]